MLTGQAKVDYQREYMRRRRAGLGKPPKGERPPTKSELFEIRHLATNQHGHRHYQTIRNRLLNGLDKDAPDFIVQAVQRLREHKRKLRAKREAKAVESERIGWRR